MIKVLNQYFPRRWAVLLVGESLLILLALTVAVALEAGRWPERLPSLAVAMKAGLITFVYQVCLHYSDLYDPHAHPTGSEVLMRLLHALGIALLVLALVYWLLPATRMGTGLVVGSVLAILLMAFVWRRAMDWGIRWSHGVYPAGERLLVVGAGDRAAALLRELELRSNLGLELVGALDEAGRHGSGHSPVVAGVPILGGLEELPQVIASKRPHRIVIAMQERRRQLPAQPLIAARAAGVIIEEAPLLFERITGRLALDGMRPSWLILSDGVRPPTLLSGIERAVGLAMAMLALVILSPFLAVAAAALRLQAPGAALKRQQCVGAGGVVFDNYLLRSSGLPSRDGNQGAMEGETASVTWIGRCVRKLRLDRAPCLYSVLRGRMALVGPRPHATGEAEERRRALPYYDLRHAVRPGVTGWAQINGTFAMDGDVPQAELEYDLFYLKNQSMWLDLFILFQTTKMYFRGFGVRPLNADRKRKSL